jgi:predicted aldo/keto reductase-like oxidoreductase
MDYLGKNIPKLGFGLMRLPKLADGARIDIEQTKVMADKFLAAGFRYFDTAWGYDNGMSEEAVKPVLVDRYPRDKFLLATKLPAWAGANTADEAKGMLATSLKRTGAGYFDFYLLHNLGTGRTEAFDKFGIWDFVKEQRDKGVIKHLGCSMHDTPEALDKVLTEHPELEFVQLQINWADWESDSVQSRKCYETALKHGKPVIIMEPVKGSMLATPPQPVIDILKKARPDSTPADWALRFAASLDKLVVVLSGMSNVKQMEENIKTFSNMKKLDAGEQKAMEAARKKLASMPIIPCTKCHYCLEEGGGCPQKVDIPGIIQQLND